MKKLFFFHTNANYLIGLRLPLLVALAQSGWKVTAFAPDVTQEHVAILRRNGIGAAQYSVDSTGHSLSRDIRDIFNLIRLFREERPDVVFANNIKPVIFGVLAAAVSNVPKRHALVGGLGYAFITPPNGERSLGRYIAKIIACTLYAMVFRLATSIIFHNADDRDLLRRWRVCPRLKGDVVPGSGVDVDEFPETAVPASPSFIFVGRLLKDKGVREYLSAAEKVKKTYPESRFIVVGAVDDNPASLNFGDVDTYVRAGVVDWVGHVKDVRPFLSEASVFVLPSYREGVPRSTLEAMAFGRAIITTNAPGCRDTVRDGVNGFLVPVGDSSSLSAAIMRFCSDPSLAAKMGRASREIAVRIYSVEKVNQAMVRILERAHE